MARKREWIIGSIIGASFLVFVLLFFIGISSLLRQPGDSDFSGFGPKVAVIDITGVITTAGDVVRQLKKYRSDASVKAILLRIDSPGGGVAASQEIYSEVKKVRDEDKPVVVSMGSVAASGGYYIACAADSIVANPGTLTGSIGVIFEFPVAEQLLKKIGLKWEVVKSGEMKDVGTFTRPLTEKERRHLQGVIDDTYDQFVKVLVENRKLPRRKVLALADGSIFTGRQAQKLGLVDQLGDYEDAVKLAGRMGGIAGEPRTVKERKRRPSWLDLLTETKNLLQQFTPAGESGPRLLYQFK